MLRPPTADSFLNTREGYVSGDDAPYASTVNELLQTTPTAKQCQRAAEGYGQELMGDSTKSGGRGGLMRSSVSNCELGACWALKAESLLRGLKLAPQRLSETLSASTLPLTLIITLTLTPTPTLHILLTSVHDKMSLHNVTLIFAS